MYWLSRNPNLPWKFIEAHPEGINGKPNLPWEFLKLILKALMVDLGLYLR